MIEFVVWLFSYILPFLAILTVIVFVHEMGHYLVARWNGVAIQTFSIGFGPEIFGFNDKHGTRWRLSAVPLGGYVRFIGDMNPASVPDDKANEKFPLDFRPRLFVNKNVWQRIAIVVAGPAANVIFTFVVLYLLLIGFGRYTIPPIIDSVVEGGPAAVAGLVPGDLIESVDGYEVRSFSDVQRYVSTSPGRSVSMQLDRLGQDVTVSLVPEVTEITDRFGNVNKIGRIGVTRQSSAEDVVFYRPTPIEAVGLTLEEIGFIIQRTGLFIADIFVGRGDLDQIGGPVKVAKISGDVATLGVFALINLAALLSLNIGLFNLLPIPMLDGGHLFFYLYEAVMKKPLNPRIQEICFRAGFVLVIGLTIFTFVNDLI